MEFLGVFFLCYCGGWSVMRLTKQGGLPVGPMALINVAFAHGIPLALLIAFGGPISGAQYNPGVSLGLLFTGQQGIVQTALYILAQLIGSLVAGVALYLLKPSSFTSNYLGYPTLAPDVTVGQGFGYETIASFLLGLAVYFGVNRGENAKTIGMWVGGALMSMINSIGPMTGASLNFARNFGPELASNGSLFNDRGGWMYYIATLLGPVLAAFLVKYFLNKDFNGCGTMPEQDLKIHERAVEEQDIPQEKVVEENIAAATPLPTTERALKTNTSIINSPNNGVVTRPNIANDNKKIVTRVIGKPAGYPHQYPYVGHISPARIRHHSPLNHSGIHHSGMIPSIHHSGIHHHSPMRRII